MHSPPDSDARWDAWAGLVLVSVCAALWVPRLGTPLDLRYDAGVYYVLGSSLAEGRGYRLANEPGAIEAVQYPPLLPWIVAAHQWATGTSDPTPTGRALRVTYALLGVLYVVAVYRLGRRWLAPGWALAATLLVALHLQLLMLSDLMFADLPFACAGVLFLHAGERPGRGRRAALFAGAAYLFRTAGLALVVAWASEALLRRRWRNALWRMAVAAVPIVVWQSHVAGVRASPAYTQPAYAYQRAAYQYYNVPYDENMSYLDPFAPERGPATGADLARRALRHARLLPVSLGESVAVEAAWPRSVLRRLGVPLPEPLIRGALAVLGLAGAAGVLGLAARGAWLTAIFWAGSLVLVAVTPWTVQFGRYLLPLAPVTALGLVVAIAAIRPPAARRLGAGLIAAILACQAAVLASAFHTHWVPTAAGGPRVFFYDEAWRLHDLAIAWLGDHADPTAVAATATPHRLYLRTGLQAVLPPFEADAGVAARLLADVPIEYLVIDELAFLDVTRRYAEPVVRAFPERWTLVYGDPDRGSRIYRRAGSPSVP